MRRSAFVAASLLVALLGVFSPVAAAQTSQAKVVIIVGADTPQYIADANELYAEAILHTPNVVRVYTPYATWNAVRAATVGANVVIYLGHGNGWPAPYPNDPNYVSKDGFVLNTVAGAGGKNLAYYGEPYIHGGKIGSKDYGPGLQMAPNAIVFLFHLCYASGNSEPGKPAPTLATAKTRADNFGSAFLRAGASAVIADGHSHDPAYLRALFTTGETLGELWRGASSYRGHEIAFTPTRSTGTAILDPDTSPSSPTGFYRSIVGNLSATTWGVIGRLQGLVIVPRREAGGAGLATMRMRGSAY